MFVKKLVEKASFPKKPPTEGLKADDVAPRLVFHYGIPSGSTLLAYNPVQKILAISTRDGRIKLFGKNGSQALFESPELLPSKFLQFIENQSILLNINTKNQIEVWDLEKRCLSHVHDFKKDITCCTSMSHAPYVYIGDSLGNVSVFKVHHEAYTIEQMKYRIPFSASHGISDEAAADIAVIQILPHPTAESKRVLIIYADGIMTLWEIQESKAIYTTAGMTFQSISHETKKVTAATWACPFGSKLVIGYSNGEIIMWSIPSPFGDVGGKEALAQNGPGCKLNLGYKLDKVPIAKLKWVYADGKSSRLYVLGNSDYPSANLLQVVLMTENIEVRTIKLGLHIQDSPVDFGIVASFNLHMKQKNDSLLLLGKSGHLHSFDDNLIERYLLQSQSKSSPSLPKETLVKLPFADPSITVAKYIVGNPHFSCLKDQDYDTLAKDTLPFFPFDAQPKDGSSARVSKAKNLYITGHSNGALKFWDATCPLFRTILSLSQQRDDDTSLSGVPLTALYCTPDLQILVSGDQSGTIRIYKFKPEFFAPEASFLTLQGVSKKSNLVHSIKTVKVKGVGSFIKASPDAKYLAVGSDQGYVSLFDMEGHTLLYERHFESELSAGIISLQFASCSLHGFDKNVIVVATKDSSVTALETDTGNLLNANAIRPKKPFRALFMEIWNGREMSGQGSNISDRTDIVGNSDNTPSKQFVVLCSEKAVYVYSLVHILQGLKKVYYKKKFHSSSCCWASTLGSPDSGITLLFSCGKIEIRSLPELSLLKETTLRGFRPAIPKSNSISSTSMCFSGHGDILAVESDQEAFFIHVLLENDVYRFLDRVSEVYSSEPTIAEGSSPTAQKEKKKGLFGVIIKDVKGTKTKSETEIEDSRASIEALSMTFSAPNFPLESENEENVCSTKDDLDLDIDDIDIEDPGEKPKGHGVMAALNKQNFTDKFQAIKGKLKHMTVKTEKTPKETVQEEKVDSVDQIKKKYGYAATADEGPGFASIAKNKLSENLKKLQGINMKSTEMQDSAKSFSSMAKDVLRFAENGKKSS
ncbi:OLC1v1010528C4 [Oldenlandia corymbosa var. corymbosa]|uniref:OLC1v1010528C4 n=1 Tax=Oldenlandia corymbosa var. corymbosa TaxID=529605 RepID=A0AAV1DU88_OLDCO|nr:OLC1v1010528C4 [Oldenlandia corymbosa var. corymbosa]